jgi:hypothetical protein
MSSHSVIEPEIVAEVTDEDFKELGIRHLRSSPRMIVLIGDITGDTIRIEEVGEPHACQFSHEPQWRRLSALAW